MCSAMPAATDMHGAPAVMMTGTATHLTYASLHLKIVATAVKCQAFANQGNLPVQQQQWNGKQHLGQALNVRMLGSAALFLIMS